MRVSGKLIVAAFGFGLLAACGGGPPDSRDTEMATIVKGETYSVRRVFGPRADPANPYSAKLLRKEVNVNGKWVPCEPNCQVAVEIEQALQKQEREAAAPRAAKARPAPRPAQKSDAPLILDHEGGH